MENKYCYNYPRPAFTVDIILIYENQILLIRRQNEPFKNGWALPGGFMEMTETPIQAAIRELQEETHIKCDNLLQFRTFGDVNRDPRHRTITTVYYKLLNKKPFAKAADDASEAKWFEINTLPEMAFDHQQIIFEFIDWSKNNESLRLKF